MRAGRVQLAGQPGLPVTAFPCVSGVEWGLIFPDANGEYQSPINLNSREAKYDPSLLEVRLSPNYVVCRDCEVINDGHSIQIALKSKSGNTAFAFPAKDYLAFRVYMYPGALEQQLCPAASDCAHWALKDTKSH